MAKKPEKKPQAKARPKPAKPEKKTAKVVAKVAKAPAKLPAKPAARPVKLAASSKPVDKSANKGDLLRLWSTHAQETSDIPSLFHQIALFLKKHIGFETMNLHTGAGHNSTLVGVHHAGSSYVSESAEFSGPAAEPGQILKEATVFLVEEGSPVKQTLRGSSLVVQVHSISENGPAILTLTAGESSPAYLKSDLQVLQSLTPLLTPVVINFHQISFRKKQAETQSQLRDLQKQAKEHARELDEQKRSIAEELTAKHQSELTALAEKQAAETEGLKEKIKSLESASWEVAEKLQSETSQVASLSEQLRSVTEKADSAILEIKQLRASNAELEQARNKAADEERAKHADRIAELELSLEEAQSESKKAHASIDSELQKVRSELQAIQAEKAKFQSELAARDRLLEEAGMERARKEDDLQKRIDEANRALEAQKADAEKEMRDLKLAKERLEQDAGNARRTTDQQTNSLRQEIAKLEEQLKQAQAQAQKELAFQEAKNREIASHLADEKTKLANEEKRAALELSKLQTIIEQKEKEALEIRATNDKQATGLKSEIQSKLAEIERMQAEIATRNKSLEESREQSAGLNRSLDELGKRAQNLESELKRNEEKTKRAETDLEGARKEIYRLQEERTEAHKRIKAVEELLLIRDRDLKQQAEELTLTHEEIAGLTADIKTLRTEKEQLQATVASQTKDLGHYRERESRLEQDVLGLQEEKRILGGKLERQAEEIAKLKQNVQQEIKERESVLSELANVRGKEKRLGEELQSALSREKGSREEGVILFNFARALAEVEDFQSRLEALRKGLSARIQINRMFAYSLRGEDRLRLEEAYSSKWLTLSGNPYFQLADTVMGTALATLKPDVLKPGMLEIPDSAIAKIIPLDEAKGPGTVIVPLAESKETLGVLCVVCDVALPESELRLLANLSPLIATSLRQRLEEEGRKGTKIRTETKNAIIAYLGHRLHKRGLEIDPARRPEEQMAGFELWANDLARSCNESGIESELEIPPKTLMRLSDIIKAPAHLYYIAMEAVDNIRLHSEATKMSIRLREDGTAIALTIEDNGEGLLRKAGTETPAKGTGLRAIRNLAVDSGAECRMSKGADGKGLKIECTWHLGD